MHKAILICTVLSGAGLLATAAPAAITPFAEDFEALDPGSETALSDEDWRVFFNVYDGDTGLFLFGFGFFPAPNAAATGFNGFSAVVSGQGDAAQGTQQLRVFNDYENPAHLDGDLVEAILSNEFVIDASNVGQTWIFRFDYKKDDLVPPTTAFAFIQTVDPANGFAIANYTVHETTDAPTEWTSQAGISLVIDASLVGSYFQFGFVSTATDYDGSGIFYDNLAVVLAADTDADGIADITDNCTDLANADQTDTNGDGLGNVCDPDVNDDCRVDFLDLAIYRDNFFLSGAADTDNNGDGQTDFLDLSVVKSFFFGPPGPGATGCN